MRWPDDTSMFLPPPLHIFTSSKWKNKTGPCFPNLTTGLNIKQENTFLFQIAAFEKGTFLRRRRSVKFGAMIRILTFYLTSGSVLVCQGQSFCLCPASLVRKGQLLYVRRFADDTFCGVLKNAPSCAIEKENFTKV